MMTRDYRKPFVVPEKCRTRPPGLSPYLINLCPSF